MQLFYYQDINESTTAFSFDKEESRHIIKVLRKRDNDILYVTNGLGIIFKTEITLASDNKCTVKVLSFEKAALAAVNLHLVVAPTKMNERYEWFLEKATEIGVQQITPVLCEHSERKIIKTERFDKIILSAMKQSNQSFLPVFNEPIAFKDFITKEIGGQKYIAHCEETDKKTLKQLLQNSGDITILIGPEGDFSEKEIKLALENGYLPVSLGNTRLRTETAAIVACHSVVFSNENN